MMGASAARIYVSAELLAFARVAYPAVAGRPNFVIHNSTEARWFQPADVSAVRARLTTRRVLGCVGPVKEQMGFAWTIEVFNELVRRGHDLSLLVIGGIHHKDREFAMDAIATCLEPKRVILTGSVPHAAVLSHMGLCDVGLLVPRTEGCPNKLLEFMLAGIPVVARPIGAIPEIIADGRTGLLVGTDQSADIADAVERLLEGAELRATLAANARRLMAESYQSSDEIAALGRVYAAVGAPAAVPAGIQR
jgi:glycosyltransferase involved in cell wall biosynthesis